MANVKPNTISDIENGKTKLPKRETMVSLANALGVSVEDLVDEMPELVSAGAA
jgi:transcriptional regulator with XRE-family HTH domain